MRTIRHTGNVLLFWGAIASGSTLAAAQSRQIEREVSLASGSLQLRVGFDHDSLTDWAAYVSSAAEVYLRSVEDYLVPLSGKGGVIQVVGGHDIRLNDRWVGGYADVGARTVFIQYDLAPIGNPSLLYHELGHLWFAENVTDQAWLVEGAVSLLPIALGEAGHEIIDGQAAWTHWGFRQLRFIRDLPTETDYRSHSTEDFTDWYRKTFKIQYLIYRELGQTGYREFLRSMMARAPVMGSPALLSLFNDRRATDWREFLSGWVFGESYLWFSWSDFDDTDHDGLVGVAEHYARTDPENPDTDGDGVPDGAEVGLGSDPLQPDDTGRAPSGPFIDGSGDEWRRLPATEITDRVGDSSGDPELDMVRMKYLVRNGFLYVMVETDALPVAREGVFFDVLRDSDGDNTYDGDFAFWLDHPAAPWHFDGGMITVPGLEGAMGSVFEIAIPLERLGSGNFQILPILRNATDETNYDEWDAWVRISPLTP